jgi:hypothetical protein
MDPDTTAKIGLALWEHVPYLKDAVRNVRRKMRDGKTVIAVFGPGGVGKTTLGTILADDFSPEKLAQDYVDTPDTEKIWLKSNDSQSILIAPGQRERVLMHWPAIQTSLTKANRPIIINVVAWGYHTPRKSVPITVGQIEEHISAARDEELRVFTDLVNFFTQTTGPLTLITLVTKEDLWWSDRDAVKSHYESGAYAEQIARLQAAKGTQNFHHEYAYISLMSRNMKSSTGEVLVPITQGYDIEIRDAGYQKFVQTLEGILK